MEVNAQNGVKHLHGKILTLLSIKNICFDLVVYNHLLVMTGKQIVKDIFQKDAHFFPKVTA